MINTALLYLLCGMVFSHIVAQREPKSTGKEGLLVYILGTLLWPLGIVVILLTIIVLAIRSHQE